LNATDGSATDAGDNIILDSSADGVDVGERLLFEGGVAHENFGEFEKIHSNSGIIENASDIVENYTITLGSNAMSVGPVTIANGKTVTVLSGSRWVVL